MRYARLGKLSRDRSFEIAAVDHLAAKQCPARIDRVNRERAQTKMLGNLIGAANLPSLVQVTRKTKPIARSRMVFVFAGTTVT